MIALAPLLLLAKVTLVLLAGLALARALGRASASVRHVVWLATLIGIVTVPAMALWAPLRIAALPPATATLAPSFRADVPSAAFTAPGDASPAGTPGALPGNTVTRGGGADASTSDAATPVTPSLLVRIGLGGLLLALWGAVALAILASFALGWLAVRRIVRRARPHEGREWRDLLYDVSDRLSLAQPPRLLRSDDATMPFACGVLRPTIVLPADSDAWSTERRRAVLLHELAHVRRRDLVGHSLGRIVCAAYWFHPLVWTAARRMRAESERACDDLALVCGQRPADYAEHLLDIVTSVRRDRTPLVALAMARRSEFEGRMLAILDPERPRRHAGRRQTIAATAGLGVLALLVGAAAPARRGASAAQQANVAQHESDHAARTDAAATDGMRSPARAIGDGVRHSPYATSADRERSRPGLLDDVTMHVDERAVSRLATHEATAMRSELRKVVGNALSSVVAPRTVPGADTASDRVTLLANVLRTDTSASIRRVAAWGLAEHTEVPAAGAALVAALHSDRDAGVREMAAWALGDGERVAGAVDGLVAALRGDADRRVRATAAWALGSIGDRDAAPALVQALADTSRTLRLRAIWALGNVVERQAPPALVALLRDPDPRTRMMTAWALYQIEDPSTVSALQAALRGEKDEQLQVAELRALAALGDASTAAIEQLLDSPDQSVRAMAVRALAGGRAAGPWPWPWPEPRPNP